MTLPVLRMTLRPYDHITPLLLGDVPVHGVEARFDWRAPLTIAWPDDLDGAEVSFNRYVLGRARGDEALMGLPAFILRGFRHRNFFVRRDSPLTTLAELRGKRLATNSWSDSGTLFARAALREAGVAMDRVQWVIGRLDEATPSRPLHPGDLVPPATAEHLAPGDTLLAALEAGRIDAITTAFAPDPVFRPDGWIRRLVQDYPEAERAYYRRTGVYPAFHIPALRRDWAEAHPEAVVALCRAFRGAWDVWWLKSRRFAEATPWAMADLETMARDFPGDTPPFGRASDSHRRMLDAICTEQEAQGLIPRAAEPGRLFAAFDALLARLGVSEAEAFSPRTPVTTTGGKM
jgi:4,5-dihydroxyphthalate decarboxylase